MSPSFLAYPNYDDLARLEYGRMLWRDSVWRDRLRRHWMDHRHPYRERFLERQPFIEELLGSDHSSLDEMDARLRRQGTSLRAAMREIPPVFGSFFDP